ncbi:hypothetical protein EW026_g7166 [Hermanssonia centrifuga]|uniref:Uncharacterized protein n=1 Tax=Hermanssonia centrifuga TaxID=98765 RepID=A0A4S4K8P6_9APHY|nr:hypothetical protein EW026_g7166 [Hermanssonia centrifuga]
MYGRESIIEQAVQAVSAPSGHVSIMGTGGVGKTSLALSILHHPDAKKNVFGDLRFFISCEGAESGVIGIWRAIVPELGVTETKLERYGLAILGKLESMGPCVICLDNLETPLEAEARMTTEEARLQKNTVQSFLLDIATLENVRLVITLRGNQSPKDIRWPLRIPLKPVDVMSALAIFKDVSGKDGDADAETLVTAVDCLPLAVTLLARIAQYEETNDVLQHWNEKTVSMVKEQRGSDKLSSLEVSIQLSYDQIQSEDAKCLLRISAMLPDGARADLLDSFASHMDSRSGWSELLYLALGEQRGSSFHVLSPIRHYVMSKYPLDPQLVLLLQEHYFSFAENGNGLIHPHIWYSRVQEMGNIEYILLHALGVLTDERARLSAAAESDLDLAEGSDTLKFVRVILQTSRACFGFMRMADYINFAFNSQQLIALVTPLCRWLYNCDPERFRHLYVRCLQLLLETTTLRNTLTSAQVYDCRVKTLAVYSLCKALGQSCCIREATSTEAYICLSNCNWKKAEEVLMVGIQSATDHHDIATMREMLAKAMMNQKRYDEAIETLQLALAHYQDIQDSLGQANAYSTLASVYRYQGGNIAAEEGNLKLALAKYQWSRTPHGQSEAHLTLGICQFDQGKLAEAETNIRHALDLHVKLKDLRAQATERFLLGIICLQLSRIEDTIDYWKPIVRNEGLHISDENHAEYLERIRDLLQEKEEALKDTEGFGELAHIVRDGIFHD